MQPLTLGQDLGKFLSILPSHCQFPGILAGSLLVFIPAIGEYVIPALLGGLDSLMIGRTLYDEFFVNRDWPLASAVATILLLILVIPIMLFQRSQRDEPQS